MNQEFRINPHNGQISTVVEYRKYWSSQGANPHVIDLFWSSFGLIEIPDGQLGEIQQKMFFIYEEANKDHYKLTINDVMKQQIDFYNKTMIERGYPEDIV